MRGSKASLKGEAQFVMTPAITVVLMKERLRESVGWEPKLWVMLPLVHYVKDNKPPSPSLQLTSSARTHTHTYTQTRTQAHTHVCTLTHRHMHEYTHTNIHNLVRRNTVSLRGLKFIRGERLTGNGVKVKWSQNCTEVWLTTFTEGANRGFVSMSRRPISVRNVSKTHTQATLVLIYCLLIATRLNSQKKNLFFSFYWFSLKGIKSSQCHVVLICAYSPYFISADRCLSARPDVSLIMIIVWACFW